MSREEIEVRLDELLGADGIMYHDEGRKSLWCIKKPPTYPEGDAIVTEIPGTKLLDDALTENLLRKAERDATEIWEPYTRIPKPRRLSPIEMMIDKATGYSPAPPSEPPSVIGGDTK